MLVGSCRPLLFLPVQDVTHTRLTLGCCKLFGYQFSVVISANRLSGGYSAGVPPLPIPNREVKPGRADGTAMQCGRVGSRLFLTVPLESVLQRDFFLFLFYSVMFFPLILLILVLQITFLSKNDGCLIFFLYFCD